MSGAQMITLVVGPSEAPHHKSVYLSQGYELRAERPLDDGRIEFTWRPTCCGGDERQR